MKEAEGDLGRAMALRFLRILKDMDLTSGKIAVYGHVEVSDLVTELAYLREWLPEVDFVGDSAMDSLFLRAMETKSEAEVERIRRLAREEIVSETELDSAELAARSRTEALEAAEFATQTGRYQLEVARARLVEGSTATDNPGHQETGSPILLRSPVDGVVLRRMRESEAVVAAGEPLLEVGEPEDLEIVADYLSADAVKIRPGDRVLIEEWGGDEPLEGRVRRVEPSGFMKISALGVEEQRVNIVVDFDDPPQARPGLADGYRVELRVVLWEGEDVLQVPTGSLFRAGEGWAVFAVEEGKAVRREIEIGRRSGLAAQVLEGLDEGAQVIVHPSDDMADGVRVEERGV